MKLLKTFACWSAVLVALAMAAPAPAQDFNPLEKTFLTFSQAVELPHMTVPAGEYQLKLADTPGRNVLQLWNREGTRLLGQWHFIPTHRMEATSDPVVTFEEHAAGSTPAVRAFFYPGRELGREFLYPKDQAQRIAQRTGAEVRIEGVAD